MTTGLVICVVLAVGFIALGIVHCTGRGAILIAGYNTMSPDEKAGWNQKQLCAATGKLMFATSLYLLFIGLVIYLDVFWPLYVSIPIVFAAVIAWVVYINKSPKFKQQR